MKDRSANVTCAEDSGAKVPTRGSQVAVANDVVAYACNSARFSKKRCYSGDVNFAVGVLEDHCKTNRAGK